ncbi:unnamed protein product [Somion occarium]|uniref:Uncharacterized protein n=1 Tax=Somion occarium TaxID=3059160 RepID=A0ABP1DDE6_9APHY
MGLSLWLVPPEPQSTQISRIMSFKTNSAKSPASFPRFHPHITLSSVSSDTDISNLRSAVPAGQVKVPIHFKSVDVGDKDNLKEALGEDTVPPLAHVSLFYIDDVDAGERQKIFEQLNEGGRIISKDDHSVALDCTEGDARGQDVIDGFVACEIWIALCDGPVEAWTIKDKIQLK